MSRSQERHPFHVLPSVIPEVFPRAYFANRDSGAALNYGNVSWNRKSSDNGTPAFWNNPYFQAYENYSTDKRYRSFSYAQLTYDINEHLNVTGKLSYDRSNLSIDNRLAKGSLAQTFGISGKDVDSGYSRRDITRTETNYDIMLNYKYDITTDINVSGVVGANVRRNYYNSIYASTEGGLVVPGLYSLENSKLPTLEPVENVSMKVVRIIQGYVNVVNKTVWRKY